MIKIIDNQKRNILGEGRNFGVGFAFLKRINNVKYETVQPISACKDYLNDVIYSEHTGKICEAYGLKYKKQGLFENEGWGYLAVSVLDYMYGNYAKKQWEIEALEKGLGSITKLLSYFEKYFKMGKRTKVLQIDKNLYIFKVPLEWCASTYMISLYSLLIRTGRWFTEGTALDYLKSFNQFDYDVYIVRDAMGSINSLLTTGKYKQNLSLNSGNIAIHNKGIVSYKTANDLI